MKRAKRIQRFHIISGLLVAFLLIAGMTASVIASPAKRATPEGVVLALSPARLTTMSEGSPTQSISGRAIIGWSHETHLGRQRALISFDLSQLPPDAQIVEARLRAQIAGASGLEQMVARVAPAANDWSLATVSWVNQPVATSDFAESRLAASGEAEWLVTPFVAEWLAAPARNYGLLIDSMADYPEDNERELDGFELLLTLAPDDLALTIEARQNPVASGGLVEYRLTLQNAAGAASLSPTITAHLPAQARFSECTDGCRVGEGRITWELADIPAAGSYTVYVTARVSPDTPAGASLSFSASARGINSPADAIAQIETSVVAPATATHTPSPTETVTAPPATPTATSETPTPTLLPTRTPTVTPTVGDCTERVSNGGFESFSAGWDMAGEVMPIIVASQRHSGIFSALLGSSLLANDVSDSTLSQVVRIPSDATDATLQFWYWLNAGEDDAHYDWFNVSVRDAAGQLLESATLTDAAGEWTVGNLDLLAHRGKTVHLYFTVHNDGNAGNTSAYLDDISLCVRRPAGPEPLPSPWPGNCALPGNLPDYAPAGVPDFSAEQSTWDGYDGPAAVANLLWWLDSLGEPGNAPPPNLVDGLPLVESYGVWDDHDPANVAPLVEDLAAYAGAGSLGTAPDALAAGIEAYIADHQLEGEYGVQLFDAPTFDTVRDYARQEAGVALLVGFWQWGDGEWLRLGGRYLTVAGVACDGQFLTVSDPLRDGAELGRPGDVLPAPDHAHSPYPPYALHNDAVYASHDLYTVARIDAAGWGLAGYVEGEAGIAESIGHNTPAGITNTTRPLNMSLPVVTRVEYAIVVAPAAIAAVPHDAPHTPDVGATLKLHLALEGRPEPPDPSWAAPALIWLQPAGDEYPTVFFATTADEWGVIDLPATLPAGDWIVRARSETTLGIAAPWATLLPGENSLTLHTLSEGDANADNVIAAADLSLLASAYSATTGAPAFDAHADFNRDGTVDASDLALLSGNLGRVGDVAAQPAGASLDVRRWDSPAATLGSVSLSLIPSVTRVMRGDIFPVAIRAEGFAQSMDTVAIHIDFDPTRFQVETVTPSSMFDTVVRNRVDNPAGQIDLVVTHLAGGGPAGAVEVGTCYLRAIRGDEETWIRFGTDAGRSADVAYQGESVLGGYNAMRVVVEMERVQLPLVWK